MTEASETFIFRGSIIEPFCVALTVIITSHFNWISIQPCYLTWKRAFPSSFLGSPSFTLAFSFSIRQAMLLLLCEEYVFMVYRLTLVPGVFIEN